MSSAGWETSLKGSLNRRYYSEKEEVSHFYKCEVLSLGDSKSIPHLELPWGGRFHLYFGNHVSKACALEKHISELFQRRRGWVLQHPQHLQHHFLEMVMSGKAEDRWWARKPARSRFNLLLVVLSEGTGHRPVNYIIPNSIYSHCTTFRPHPPTAEHPEGPS